MEREFYKSNGFDQKITVPFCPESKLSGVKYTDQDSMISVYACADMFVIPSLEDNLPNTIMESMACGTPCVGFETGGIPEMIDHLKNGYVAKYKDTEDLAEGIKWIIDSRESLQLSEACIRKVHDCYQESVVAGRYIDLYRSLTSP